jgi:hypothetical protein
MELLEVSIRMRDDVTQIEKDFKPIGQNDKPAARTYVQTLGTNPVVKSQIGLGLGYKKSPSAPSGF